MRIRQIKPGFWVDKTMAALPWRTRLIYIGLWQLADDAGWLSWDVAQIGAELLPFESSRMRERWLGEDLERLIGAGRIVRHDCGHLEIPTLTEHQRFGGRPVYTVHVAHARDCARVRANAHDGTVGEGKVGDVTERDVTVAGFDLVRNAAKAIGIAGSSDV